MLFQVGVLDARLAGGREGISHAQDDEPTAFAGVEDAGAVLKCAGLGAEFTDLSVLEIEHQHGLDGFGDLLAIGAHILYRGSAHATRTAAHAFDASAISDVGSG